MENLSLYKVRISVLWLLAMLVEMLSFVFTIAQRGFTDQIDGFPTDNATILFLSLIFLVASAMAFLSLTLNDKTNRWANIIVGIVYVVITLGHLIAIWVLPSYNPTYHTIPLWGASFIFKVLIVWYAYKWPKN